MKIARVINTMGFSEQRVIEFEARDLTTAQMDKVVEFMTNEGGEPDLEQMLRPTPGDDDAGHSQH